MLARFFLLLALLVTWALLGVLFPPFLALALALMMGLLTLLASLYPDKLLLHYLQARETIERDHPRAYRIARAQAHKFKLPPARIYSYSGFFNRSFALVAHKRVVFVVERRIMESAGDQELSAMFFTLALETRQQVAQRHTLALLLVALLWLPPLKLASALGKSAAWKSWLVQYLIAPLAKTVYGLCLPNGVWQKFLATLAGYPHEAASMRELNAQLEQPRLLSDDSRTLAFRFYSAQHAPSQQMILALESMSHPYDFLALDPQGMAHA